METEQHLKIPLCQADCQQAIKQAARWQDPASAEQVKYNTLAALAASYYLKLIGVASESLEKKPNFLQATFPSWGELLISSAQRLRCLPVVAGHSISRSINEAALSVQPDDSCLGVLAVQIDLTQREVQILGFLSRDRLTDRLTERLTERLSDSLKLQPLTALIKALEGSPIASLQQWLTGAFEVGWQQMYQPRPRTRMAFCFRSSPESDATESALLDTIRHTQNDEQRWQAAEQLWELNPHHPKSPVLRTKDLGLYLAGHSVTLLVGVLAKADGERLILARVLPAEQKPYLPRNLTLTGADSAGDTVFSIQSRSQDDYIQFKFTAAAGDRFQLHISASEASVTEHFIV